MVILLLQPQSNVLVLHIKTWDTGSRQSRDQRVQSYNISTTVHVQTLYRRLQHRTHTYTSSLACLCNDHGLSQVVSSYFLLPWSCNVEHLTRYWHDQVIWSTNYHDHLSLYERSSSIDVCVSMVMEWITPSWNKQ